ncbi:MAG: tetratricopeptide repeat protein [Deltaproteobacteria bacterium]|nr:tetratricopeptide repeat protein [Deltaproteobacteria bacterium]
MLFPPLLAVALVLFMRHPRTNYIFDEQEALLGNPYVNAVGGLRFMDFLHRDFWGLPPNASIGSYRPIPNVLWRLLWSVSRHPFFHHLYNIAIHALNGAILGSFAYSVTRRRAAGWLAAASFVVCALLTEAVTGIVGIADVLGGLGAVLALLALRLPAWATTPAVFAAVALGMFSKESAMVCVPLVPLAALLCAPMLHPQRPARLVRALLALGGALGAFVLYVELRRRWFPSPLPEPLSRPLAAGAGTLARHYRELLVWFHQAPLPNDWMNNPLCQADLPHRVAGALRVYWRGLLQVFFPFRLSGDYSYPQEPVPATLFRWESVAGGLLMALPLCAALVLALVGRAREWLDGRRMRQAAPGSFYVLPQPSGTPLIRLGHRPWRRPLLASGFVLGVAGLCALATEAVLIYRGGSSSIRLWPYAALVLAVGVGLFVEGWRSQPVAVQAVCAWPMRRLGPALVALGLAWLVVSYFPHSNIPVLLPTVRAERFWYFPAIGTSLVLAVLFAWLGERWWRLPLGLGWLGRKLHLGRAAASAAAHEPRLATAVLGLFFGLQAVQTYRHAMDYRDDLAFWEGTKKAVPRSAKAHLNYSVMTGARGDLETRLAESRIAASLAPEWPMAHVYTGDTLCRMHRPDEAWPHYARGFGLDPNGKALIALALQCLYDEKRLLVHDAELRALADAHPGSWLAYLAVDTLNNHERHKGVEPKHRPRGYNEGPKQD